MNKLEDKFTGRYEEFRNINLQSSDNANSGDCFAYAVLDFILESKGKDKPFPLQVPVASMSWQEWEMLKYAQWLITRHKLDKADRKALEGYKEGKRIFEDVVSGRYGEQLKAEQEQKQSEEKARKERESGILQF